MHRYCVQPSRLPNCWDICLTVAASMARRAPVDTFRTHSGAEYAARLLNTGTAQVDPHACLGCRVISRELVAA